jgi:hypothetical protein
MSPSNRHRQRERKPYLERDVPGVDVSFRPIHLLCLDALIDDVSSVEVSREVTEGGEEDVDQEVARTSGDETGRGWGEEDG